MRHLSNINKTIWKKKEKEKKKSHTGAATQNTPVWVALFKSSIALLCPWHIN